MEVAEGRHQEVMTNMASVEEQNHRAEVAQLTGEAVTALGEQASRHVDATERLRREAAASHDDITHYLSAKQAAENQTRAVHAEMMRADSIKEKGAKELVGFAQGSTSYDRAERGKEHLTDRSRLREGCSTRSTRFAVVPSSLSRDELSIYIYRERESGRGH